MMVTKARFIKKVDGSQKLPLIDVVQYRTVVRGSSVLGD